MMEGQSYGMRRREHGRNGCLVIITKIELSATQSVSQEDRKPEGCHTCFNLAKHGGIHSLTERLEITYDALK